MAYPLQPIVHEGATLTLNRETHGEGTVVLKRAAGVAVTLPLAVGSGDKYRVVVGTTVSSNSVAVTTSGSDTMAGFVSTATATAGNGLHEAAAGSDDTITMNGTTTGGIAGSVVECVDMDAGVWLVNGHLVGSGTLASSIS